jgi:hypothetical protein
MNFISEEYSIDPDTVTFNDEYVEFNELHTQAQYESTKLNIQENGQVTPIYMLNGRCIDGRHRTRVAKELGKYVKCIDVNPELHPDNIIMLCNENIMSGRDYNVAQKAIKALQLVVNRGMKLGKAAVLMKVDRRMVSYASTIKGYGRDDILEALLHNTKVRLNNMERPSGSLEVLCKMVKLEDEVTTISEDTTERIYFDPEAIIKTERGKAEYYSIKERLEIGNDEVELNKILMEYVNLKYKRNEKVNDEL